MKKIFINLIAFVFVFSTIASGISTVSAKEVTTQEMILLENDFLYDIGIEDPFLNEFSYDDMEDYIAPNNQVIQPRFAQFVPMDVI